jgi:hypothetical protein
MPPHTIDVRLSSPMALKRKILAMTTTSQFSLPTPLLSWEPTNEQEVVLLFGYLLHYGVPYVPRPIIIESVGTTFPDCRARALDGDKGEIWIEFEVFSSAYKEHLGRPERCDWIVCWADDRDKKLDPDSKWPEIVVELCEKVRASQTPLIKTLQPLHLSEADYFQQRIAALSDRHRSVVARVQAFAEEHRLRLASRSNGSRRTACRDDGLELLSITVDGRIGTPFSRWYGLVAPAEIARIVEELNAVTGWKFSADGKLGADIEQLLPDDAKVEDYLDVWRRFLDSRQQT